MKMATSLRTRAITRALMIPGHSPIWLVAMVRDKDISQMPTTVKSSIRTIPNTVLTDLNMKMAVAGDMIRMSPAKIRPMAGNNSTGFFTFIMNTSCGRQGALSKMLRR